MKHGGRRPGAGRPAGSQNADTAAMRAALSGLLEGQVAVAIEACAILDRTHGRPRAAPNAAPLHGTPPGMFDLVIGNW